MEKEDNTEIPKLNGRPKEHDRKQLAIDIIEWAKKEDSLNMNGFCISLKPPVSATTILRIVSEDNNFREAYHTAQAFLAERREKALVDQKLHNLAYSKNLHVYDKFTEKQRNKDIAYQEKIRSKVLKELQKSDELTFGRNYEINSDRTKDYNVKVSPSPLPTESFEGS